jgi:hypothetical protein
MLSKRFGFAPTNLDGELTMVDFDNKKSGQTPLPCLISLQAENY